MLNSSILLLESFRILHVFNQEQKRGEGSGKIPLPQVNFSDYIFGVLRVYLRNPCAVSTALYLFHIRSLSPKFMCNSSKNHLSSKILNYVVVLSKMLMFYYSHCFCLLNIFKRILVNGSPNCGKKTENCLNAYYIISI